MSGGHKDSQRKGNIGEAFTQYILVKEFGWIYRPFFSDIGIDGEIEIIENEKSKSSFIKVQVKARSSDTIGFSEEELVYWTKIVSPVIIIFYDLTAHEAYYQKMTKELIENMLRSNRTLKKSNLKRLDSNAKQDLVDFAESTRQMQQSLTFANQMLFRRYSFLESILEEFASVVSTIEGLGTDATAKDFGKASNIQMLYNSIQQYMPWSKSEQKTSFDIKFSDLEKKVNYLKGEFDRFHNSDG